MHVLLLLAVLFQTPSPTVDSKNPVVHDGASSGREGTPKNKSKGNLPPRVVQNVRAPSTPQPAGGECNKQSESPERTYKVDVVTPPSKPLDTPLFPVYLLLTGIGVFVNALIWILIFVQTKLNQRTLNSMKGAERAWIVIHAEPMDGLPLRPTRDNGVAVFKYKLKNTGRTPARLIETNTRFCLRRKPEFAPEPRYENLVGYSLNKILLVPNDSLILIDVLDPFDPLTLEHFSAMREGNMHLIAHGYAKYIDVYGDTHITRFCVSYQFMRGEMEGFFPYLQAPPSYTECD